MSKPRRGALELDDHSLTFSTSPVSSSSHSNPSHDGDHPTLVSETPPLYFVHSPVSTFSTRQSSTLSHGQDTPPILLSPTTTTYLDQNQDPKFSIPPRPQRNVRSALPLYSTSRGSSHRSIRYKSGHGFFKLEEHTLRERRGNGDDGEEEDGDADDGSSHDTIPLCIRWVQVIWKASVSFGVAMLVFYLLTRPPTPQLRVKGVKVNEFRLGEGVDKSGVPTKILNCNCSLDLELDNKSRIFGVHLHQPTMRLDFQNFNVAVSHGHEMYVQKDTLLRFRVFMGSRGKAVYAAGQAMQSMMEETMRLLPLVVHVSMDSHIRVVWEIVKPKFTHLAHCSIDLLVARSDDDSAQYPKAHLVQNSTCATSSM